MGNYQTIKCDPAIATVNYFDSSGNEKEKRVRGYVFLEAKDITESLSEDQRKKPRLHLYRIVFKSKEGDSYYELTQSRPDFRKTDEQLTRIAEALTSEKEKIFLG